MAHVNLGNVLSDRKDLAGAEASFREAVRLGPKEADAHSGLASALQQKGDLDGAIAEYKEALQLEPKNPDALGNLRQAEQLLQLLPRLPDVLAGNSEPATPAEACVFARLCAPPFQRRYAAAVRLFEGAFRADPKLAADLKAAYRYDAACYAVRAAGGERGSMLPPTPRPGRPCGRIPLVGCAPTWPSTRSRPPRRTPLSAARPQPGSLTGWRTWTCRGCAIQARWRSCQPASARSGRSCGAT
jgi:tetratricopeptide (TPR) repeat protein